jgi:hypothetical protein
MVWPLSDELPCLLIERVELDEMVVCNPPLARRPMCMTLVIMGESFPKIEIHELTLCLTQHVHFLSETIGQVVRGFVGFSLERHQATVPSNTSLNKGQGAKPKWKRNLGRGRPCDPWFKNGSCTAAGLGLFALASGRQGVTGSSDEDHDFHAEDVIGANRPVGFDIKIEGPRA